MSAHEFSCVERSTASIDSQGGSAEIRCLSLAFTRRKRRFFGGQCTVRINVRETLGLDAFRPSVAQMRHEVRQVSREGMRSKSYAWGDRSGRRSRRVPRLLAGGGARTTRAVGYI
jgi:hypothetical protein